MAPPLKEATPSRASCHALTGRAGRRGARLTRHAGSLSLYHSGNIQLQDQHFCGYYAPIGSTYGKYTVMAVLAGPVSASRARTTRERQCRGAGHGAGSPQPDAASWVRSCVGSCSTSERRGNAGEFDGGPIRRSGVSGRLAEQFAPRSIVAIARGDHQHQPMTLVCLVLPFGRVESPRGVKHLSYRGI